jgi:hypothetical protein
MRSGFLPSRRISQALNQWTRRRGQYLKSRQCLEHLMVPFKHRAIVFSSL